MPGVARILAVAAVALVAAAAVPTGSAKLSLVFDRSSAKPGERVSLTFGEYFVSRENVVHVYLVRASILGRVIRPALGGGVERLGPPPRLRGVVKVGTTRSGAPGLLFRVPRVPAGRYAAVIWCSTCASRYLLASFPGSVPDDAAVRPTRSLLRILR